MMGRECEKFLNVVVRSPTLLGVAEMPPRGSQISWTANGQLVFSEIDRLLEFVVQGPSARVHLLYATIPLSTQLFPLIVAKKFPTFLLPRDVVRSSAISANSFLT